MTKLANRSSQKEWGDGLDLLPPSKTLTSTSTWCRVARFSKQKQCTQHTYTKKKKNPSFVWNSNLTGHPIFYLTALTYWNLIPLHNPGCIEVCQMQSLISSWSSSVEVSVSQSIALTSVDFLARMAEAFLPPDTSATIWIFPFAFSYSEILPICDSFGLTQLPLFKMHKSPRMCKWSDYARRIRFSTGGREGRFTRTWGKVGVERAGHQEVERNEQVPLQISFAYCSALGRLRIQGEKFSFHSSSPFCTPQNTCLPNHITQSNDIKMT